jgi:hypothetical protein
MIRITESQTALQRNLLKDSHIAYRASICHLKVSTEDTQKVSTSTKTVSSVVSTLSDRTRCMVSIDQEHLFLTRRYVIK